MGSLMAVFMKAQGKFYTHRKWVGRIEKIHIWRKELKNHTNLLETTGLPIYIRGRGTNKGNIVIREL